MSVKSIWYSSDGRLRIIWRMLLFVVLLVSAVSPLLLIKNTLLQFFGVATILILALYFNARYLDRQFFDKYGLMLSKSTFLYFFTGAMFGAITVELMLLVGKVIGVLVISDQQVYPDFTSLSWFAVKMTLVAIIEESLYRGYLFTTLEEAFQSLKMPNRFGLVCAIMVSSILFGLAHIGNQGASVYSIGFLTVNGIVWCIPFIITRNLGLSIGLHTAWNFTQSLIGFTMSGNRADNSFFVITNTGNPLITGGDYGPEAGFLGLFGYISMLLFTILFLKVYGWIKGEEEI